MPDERTLGLMEGLAELKQQGEALATQVFALEGRVNAIDSHLNSLAIDLAVMQQEQVFRRRQPGFLIRIGKHIKAALRGLVRGE